MMTGKKGRSGVGSGGPGRGQGAKRKHISIESGMTLSISRVSNNGRHVQPAFEAEIIHVGGDTGHDQQFVAITPNETWTFFVDGQTTSDSQQQRRKRTRSDSVLPA